MSDIWDNSSDIELNVIHIKQPSKQSSKRKVEMVIGGVFQTYQKDLVVFIH